MYSTSEDCYERQQLISQNYQTFRSLVAQAEGFAQRGHFNMAAIYADMADEYASWMGHCGLFVSPELEHILLTIGQKAIKNSQPLSRNQLCDKKPRNILHVVYSVWSIGGHSRLLWRWIQQDAERSHSVVLTRMSVADVPEALSNAVYASRGKLYALNETVGNFLSLAERLQQIANSADVVVLHTGYDGCIPVIAFANREQSPPIIYVNHADERFWTGISISDVVANLRETGMRLSQNRRGVELDRNLIIPTIIEVTKRETSQTEAKRQLKINESTIVLLSIARAVKYRTSDGTTFADAHIAFLKSHKNAMLIVVGPGDDEDWSAVIQQTQGRIRVYGETNNTAVFYQAADIYIDSFPFVSITSLLEAGIYGVPLVSRYPYSSDKCEIFGADMPGLTGNLIQVKTLEEYTKVLDHLVEDEKFRLSLGEKTKQQIEKIHTGDNWQKSLDAIYERAIDLPRMVLLSELKDEVSISEPDVLLQKICPFQKADLDELILKRARLMPLNKRFLIWFKQIRKGKLGRMGNISLLFPSWIYVRIASLVKSRSSN